MEKIMANLIRAYPKDVSMMIEIPLKEMENLLDYIDRAVISFDGEKEPEFKKTVDNAIALIKSFDEMCGSVRSFHDVS
jgi:hypothetical protein